eukprot:NODE_269_length_11261_cov_0.600359.p11 type:complete len:173 gc:universal NODE_269_length_11261_cov_0.600359:6426-6944(+)
MIFILMILTLATPRHVSHKPASRRRRSHTPKRHYRRPLKKPKRATTKQRRCGPNLAHCLKGEVCSNDWCVTNSKFQTHCKPQYSYPGTCKVELPGSKCGLYEGHGHCWNGRICGLNGYCTENAFYCQKKYSDADCVDSSPSPPPVTHDADDDDDDDDDGGSVRPGYTTVNTG